MLTSDRATARDDTKPNAKKTLSTICLAGVGSRTLPLSVAMPGIVNTWLRCSSEKATCCNAPSTFDADPWGTLGVTLTGRLWSHASHSAGGAPSVDRALPSQANETLWNQVRPFNYLGALSEGTP
eukprot:7855138-Pyramimonas_sp.AAC.1